MEKQQYVSMPRAFQRPVLLVFTFLTWTLLHTTVVHADYPTCAVSLPINGLKVGSNQFVVSGGKVGINTAFPEADFTINSSVQGSGYGGLKVGGSDTAVTGSALYVNKYSEAVAVGAPGLIVSGPGSGTTALNPGGGNLGIGTLAPAYPLDISGNMRAKHAILSSWSASTGGASSFSWELFTEWYTNFNCATAFSFADFRIGTTKTLIVTDTGTTKCTFPTSLSGADAATVTYYFNPANAPRYANTHTIYRMHRIGNVIYVDWHGGVVAAPSSTCTLSWTNADTSLQTFTNPGDYKSFDVRPSNGWSVYDITTDATCTFVFSGTAGGGRGGSSDANGIFGGGGGSAGAVTNGTVVTLYPGKAYQLKVGGGGDIDASNNNNNVAVETKFTNVTDGVVLVHLNPGLLGGQGQVSRAGGTVVVGTNGVTGGYSGYGGINAGAGAATAGESVLSGAGGGGGGGDYNSLCPCGSSGASGGAGSGGAGSLGAPAFGVYGGRGGDGRGAAFSGVLGNFGFGGGGNGGAAGAGNAGGNGIAIFTFVSAP